MTQMDLPGNTRRHWGAARWLAFLWALAFAGMHGYWLDGGRVGLPSDVLISTGSALFWSSLIAMPALAFAGVVALAGGRPRVPITRRQTLWILTGVVVFCVLHCFPAMLHVSQAWWSHQPLSATERERYALIYEANWLMGGLYFWLALLGVSREAGRAHSA